MKIAQTSLTLGIVRSRSRSWRDFEIFLHLPQYKLSGPISQLWLQVGKWWTCDYYSCGLSTATIEYSCLCVCVCVCVCVCACVHACERVSLCLSVCVHDNSKNNPLET